MDSAKHRNSIFQELASLIGEDDTMKLVSRFGGRSISIVSAVRHELSALIGAEKTQILSDKFRFIPIYVPKRQAARMAARNLELKARFDNLTQSMSARSAVAQLSQEYDICEIRVWQILKKPDPAHPAAPRSLKVTP